MSLSQNELIDNIKQMSIYSYDYEIIKKILNLDDAKLFTKIVEEVANDNLKWLDFEPLLSNTNYEEVLTENVKIQSELYKKLDMISTFNKNSDSRNAGTEFIIDSTSDIYESELASIRDRLLEAVIKIDPADNVVTTTFKIKLFNMLKNGNIIKNMTDADKTAKNIEVDDLYIYKKDQNGNIINQTEYIDSDSILLNLNDYLIPLHYSYMQLDDFDRSYMEEHNIDDEQMKQFKSLSLFLRSNSGGTDGE